MNKRAILFACVPALLAAVFGLLPGAAAAAAGEETPLAPELATLAEPGVAAAPEAAQAEAISLPAEGPGSLIREGGDVVVEARFDSGAAGATEALEAAGATVLDTSTRYQTVALSIAPEDLEALAAVPGLEAVEPSYQPVFYGAEEGEGGTGLGPTTSLTSNGLCEGGSVTSQAMAQLHVAAARGTFGARGAGQTIGVISDSYNVATEAIGGGTIASRAHDDEVSNDLPGPESTCSGQQVAVNVLAEGPAGEGTDEGRAMLQVIHDLAPHAQLAFATAYSTEVQFAENIERLARPVAAGGAGATVIVDDVGYFAEPVYQDGPVAVAIKKVTEAGVTYLTAAGNDNLISGGNEFASWERSSYVDAECPPVIAAGVGTASAKTCMNFSPTGTADTTFGITVEAESQLILDLQWAEPWFGVEADLDAYLISANGKEELLVAEPGNNIGGGNGTTSRGRPVEIFGWENPSSKAVEVQLVIDRCIQACNSAAKTSAKPRLKFMLMQNGGGVSKTEYLKSEAEGITVGPTIYGHAGAASAITLAAVNWVGNETGTSPKSPERYSSRGPVTHYFGPVSGTTPAAKISGGEAIAKPNVTATDCASTTFFATPVSGGWRFCGTSEAAPHAAAIAALMRQTQPAATPSSIRAALGSSATPFTASKPEAVGGGLVNAEAAITAIGGTAVADPASTVVGAVVSPVQETKTTPNPVVTETTTTTTTTTGGKSSSSGGGTKAKPKARIVAHPKALEQTRRSSVLGRFRFAADQSGVTFYCQVDGSAQRVCGARFQRRFGIGAHVLKVRAFDAADNTSSSPVTFRFRVKRVGR